MPKGISVLAVAAHQVFARCYITEDTKAKLTAHAEELKAFGVTLEEHAIPEDEVLRLRLDEPEQVLSYYRADKAAGK